MSSSTETKKNVVKSFGAEITFFVLFLVIDIIMLLVPEKNLQIVLTDISAIVSYIALRKGKVFKEVHVKQLDTVTLSNRVEALINRGSGHSGEVDDE